MKPLPSIKNIFLVISFVLITFSPSIAQQNKNLISNYLNLEREKNNWLQSDIAEWNISDDYIDETTGIEHLYIQQKYHNIIVYNAISVFAIKENKIHYFKAGLIDSLAKKVNADKPSITSLNAIDLALNHLGKTDFLPAKLIDNDIANNRYHYSNPDISKSPIKVQLVYRQLKERIILSWDVSIDMKGENHWWNIRVNAVTGKIVDQNDYTVECFKNDFSPFTESNKIDSEISLESSNVVPPSPTIIPDYNVFPYPIEAPTFGSRSLLIDPSNASASPYGWQDVNGIAGAEYTITRGNNVYAYEDANNDNLPGYSPNGGANLHFSFPLQANVTPITNQDASLTNLFYDNNTIHDYLYQLGFTEAAGNFQQNNYGKGGIGGDYVKAEGFDGSGANNANFSTPPDGSSGRMQMYLWNGNTAVCTSLNLSSSTFSGGMNTGTATYNPVSTLTANLILVNDNVGTFSDGCSTVLNNIAGKIAVIDRGTCSFIVKTQGALAAGAVGVIIINNTTGSAPAMSGSPTQTIPTVSISQADGVILKNALLAGSVSGTIATCNSAYQIDGSFDNGVVGHEYGHGVSNRLTGGPSQTSCLTNGEQGGEGWSDWLALIMTIKSGDHGTDSRGMATYAAGQTKFGNGIRRYPYSTNMSINPQTYASLALSAEVHNVGEIWCDVIWDMSWLLIDQYGFSNNPSTISSGNNIAIKLVLEGMKLQPCGPGFLDARDAILAADALLYNNAHRCLIWTAFARRGMGANALQGSATTTGDETQGFLMPAYCSAPTQIPVAAFTSNLININCGTAIKFIDQSTQAFDWLWDFGDQTTSVLPNPSHTFSIPGTFTVKLLVTNPLGWDSTTHPINVYSTFMVQVFLSPNIICSADTVHLNATASGSTNRSYTVSPIPYTPIVGTGTVVSLSDDQISTSKPIGFTFNFFGQNYSNFYISSNGFITFSSGMPATAVYGETIPSTNDPDNFIALAWNDLNPQNAGSSISYFNTGTSPNQKLVVKYATSHYAGTSYPFIVQAILFEGTNTIEIHTTTISDVSIFDPEAKTTQGVENLDGSNGVPVPGRNSTFFTANNDAYRFIPFVPYSFTWQPDNLIGAQQTIFPASSIIYTVSVNDGTSCHQEIPAPDIIVIPCTIALNLKLFIQGFYAGNNLMFPVLNTTELNANITACDTITVELHDPLALTPALKSNNVLLSTNGQATISYPKEIIGNDYYIVIRHRNSIETWSKNPVHFSGNLVTFDFTTP